MKKIIALALVLVMALSMTTVAFAAADYNPGKKFTVDPDDFFAAEAATEDDKTKTIEAYAADDTLTEIFNAQIAGSTGSKEAEKYFTSDNFSIYIKFDKGRDLVESYGFNNEGKIEVKLKKSDLKSPSIPNLIVSECYIKAKKDITQYKADGTGAKIQRNAKFNAAFVGTGFTVGWDLSEPKVGDDVALTAGESKLVKFVKNGTATYDTSTFEFGGMIYGEMRVYDGDKFYLSYNEDVNLDIVKANPNADLSFVNAGGEFNTAMSIELYADEDAFVYEFKDGKLTPTTLKWDKDAYAFTGKVSTLGSYVISDVKLTNLVIDKDAAEETKNPNTGANDVVGVAVALAVVSLVAAGAVSLKK